MKAIRSVLYLFLLFISEPLHSTAAADSGISLTLLKGDQLYYEIGIEGAEKRSDFNRATQSISYQINSGFRLQVEEIVEPGIYLFSYKKLYTQNHQREGKVEYGLDSRFPAYGQDFRAIIASYLNSVDVSFVLNTKKGSMSAVNLDQIRSGLWDYLKSRGVEMDAQTKLECDFLCSEKRILEDLFVLNFYPIHQGTREWSIYQTDGNRELFSMRERSDSAFCIRSEIPEFKTTASSDGVVQKGVRLPRELLVDPNTGILLQARSLSKSQLADPEKGSSNYQYGLKLIRYSRWDQATQLNGEVSSLKSGKLCLENKSGLAGSEKDHLYLDLKADGTFEIPLEIHKPVRYRLYFLESFPVRTNRYISLYVEPGDSIYMSIDSPSNLATTFSGRGYRNSEFLNSSVLHKRLFPYFKYISLRYMVDDSHLEWLSQFETSMIETERVLEEQRDQLSPGFYSFMHAEMHSLAQMIKIVKLGRDLKKEIESGEKNSISLYKSLMPQVPNYPYLNNLELFAAYASQCSSFSFLQLLLLNKGRYGYHPNPEQMGFSKILLEGYPLYADLVHQLEEIAKSDDRRWMNYKYVFGDFLISCNNLEISDYISKLYDRVEELQAGNEMPTMNLLDMDGKEFDWNQTRGKIVVLMLFKDYNSAHYLSEDLYTEYGYNKEDVVVLRISPGISFEHWKEFNSRYSTEKHQMYFVDGEDQFNKRFAATFLNSGFLIIDRNGQIFRNTSMIKLKTAIKMAIALPPAPKTPFIKTPAARILFGVLLGLLVSLALYRFFLYRKLKRRALLQKMSELEHRALKAQLNPHFLFNSLNSIQHLIRSNQLKDADAYLSVFATLIRKILDYSEKESLPVAEEMAILERYLQLEQMRLDFELEIKIDPEIDVHNTMIPTMMLQPLIENALLHGLAPLKGKGKLIIEAQVKKDMLIFSVEDNGIGRQASSNTGQAHESRGLQLIQSRIDLLNRTDPGTYELTITDLKDPDQNSRGTRVELKFPDET